MRRWWFGRGLNRCVVVDVDDASSAREIGGAALEDLYAVEGQNAPVVVRTVRLKVESVKSFVTAAIVGNRLWRGGSIMRGLSGHVNLSSQKAVCNAALSERPRLALADARGGAGFAPTDAKNLRTSDTF